MIIEMKINIFFCYINNYITKKNNKINKKYAFSTHVFNKNSAKLFIIR